MACFSSILSGSGVHVGCSQYIPSIVVARRALQCALKSCICNKFSDDSIPKVARTMSTLTMVSVHREESLNYPMLVGF